MTRKRFVKLMMAQGMSRNAANVCALFVVSSNKSYDSEYKSYAAMQRLSNSVSSLGDSFQKAAQAISAVCNAIGVAASAFSSVLAVAMEAPSAFGGKCSRCDGTGLECHMQSLAQIGGPSLRGPDSIGVCSQCLGAGRSIL